MMKTHSCCAECGKEEGGDAGVNLKTCASCKLVKYCNAKCQRNHWATHKKTCKQRAAELRDEALFKDPPPKEDCQICFLPMTMKIICCASLPLATISSVPIDDFAKTKVNLANEDMEQYFTCCGKSICRGCFYSIIVSNFEVAAKCPFCNADQANKTVEERVEELSKRVEALDAGAICQLGSWYYHGREGVQQDWTKAMELYTRAAALGNRRACYNLADAYYRRGDLNKARFHTEAAAMAGDEVSRHNLGCLDENSGNIERAIKHWTIAASAGYHSSMHNLLIALEKGHVRKESIDSTLKAYNNSCAEMRSEARDNYIQTMAMTISLSF